MKPKGFTLIELLVVVAIIGILATVILASLGSAQERARDAKRQQDIRTIQTQLEMYYFENGRYPSSAALAVGVTNSDIHNAVSNNTSWESLEAIMGVTLPRDPVNNAVGDGDYMTNTGEYGYLYRNVNNSGFCFGQRYQLYYKFETGDNAGNQQIYNGGTTC